MQSTSVRMDPFHVCLQNSPTIPGLFHPVSLLHLVLPGNSQLQQDHICLNVSDIRTMSGLSMVTAMFFVNSCCYPRLDFSCLSCALMRSPATSLHGPVVPCLPWWMQLSVFLGTVVWLSWSLYRWNWLLSSGAGHTGSDSVPLLGLFGNSWGYFFSVLFWHMGSLRWSLSQL